MSDLLELVEQRDRAASAQQMAERLLERHPIVAFVASRLRGTGIVVWFEENNLCCGKTEYYSGDHDFNMVSVPLATVEQGLEAVKQHFAAIDERAALEKAKKKAAEEEKARRYKEDQLARLQRELQR